MQTDNNGFNYYSSLDEAKRDNCFPIHVRHLLEFYRLKGKSSDIAKEKVKKEAANLEGEWGDLLKHGSALSIARKNNGLTKLENNIKLIKDNLEPIPDLKYLLYSPQEEKYYVKDFRGYDLDTFYFYRPTLTFSGEDEAVKSLRGYIEDGNIYLLLTPEMVTDTSKMLQRLWKTNLEGEGKVSYRLYVEILDLSLKLEDYKDYGRELTGFKTACHSIELKIDALWKKVYEQR